MTVNDNSDARQDVTGCFRERSAEAARHGAKPMQAEGARKPVEGPLPRRYVSRVDHIDVLVLHGSPGAGKTTLARAMAELLRESETANAVIDLDDLNQVYPHRERSFARDNLKAIWPNYAAIPDLRLVIPSVIADQDELVQLRAALPGSRLVVCELTAPEAVLKDRVSAREPNEYWREALRTWVDRYHQRSDLASIRDFQVSTHDRPVDEAAQEVIEKAGWQAR
jgi:chloramphenicol 3-O-phosphotransferase